MSLKPHVRAGLTLTVLMFALLFLLLPLGANIGPVELLLWLVILVVGWGLCLLGGRRARSNSSS